MYQFRMFVPFFVVLLWSGLFQPSESHAITGLTLTWQNNATNADGIIIQRRLYSAPDTTFTEIWRVLRFVNKYIDTTAAVGQKYCYRVGAYNAVGVNYSNVNCGLIAPPPTAPAPPPGDLDGDGLVTCNDLAIVKASFGKLSGQSGFDPRADTNKDGVVNIIDLAYVAQRLPANTICP